MGLVGGYTLVQQMDTLAVYVNGKTDGTQLADIRQAATTLAIAKHKYDRACRMPHAHAR